MGWRRELGLEVCSLSCRLPSLVLLYLGLLSKRKTLLLTTVSNLNRDYENPVVQGHELLYGELLDVRRGREELPVDKVLVLRSEGEKLLQKLLLGSQRETVEDL